MTKILDEYFKEVEQKRTRVRELNQTIKNGEDNLSDLKNKYEKAVIEDSSNIDDLFHDMEMLQKKIRADKHKLGTLKTVTEDHLRHNAIKVLGNFRTIKPKYQAKVSEVKADINKERKRHEEVMAKLYKKGDEINHSYEDEALIYWDIINDHGIVGGIKKPHSFPSGIRPDLDEIHEAKKEKAIKEARLIPNQLYSEIERSAEGVSHLMPFKLKDVGVN